MWKCSNDIFGYCNGEPEWAEQPIVQETDGKTISGVFGGTCKLDKESCGRFQRFEQEYPVGGQIEPSELKRTLILDSNTKADTGQQSQMIEITKEQIEQKDAEARGRDAKPRDLTIKMFNDEEYKSSMEEWKGMPEYKHDDLTPFRTIMIHFRNNEDIQTFAKQLDQNITPATKYLWYPKIFIEEMMNRRWVSES